MLALLLLSVDALSPGSPISKASTRRAALLSATPVLLAPFAALAVGDNKVGYACRGNEDCGVDALAKLRLTQAPGQGEAAGIRFAGTYIEPDFPDLPRKLILAGSNVIITGTDSKGGKEWKVKGKPYGKAIVFDMSVRGGDKETIARWNGLGLAFEDGSVWKKK